MLPHPPEKILTGSPVNNGQQRHCAIVLCNKIELTLCVKIDQEFTQIQSHNNYVTRFAQTIPNGTIGEIQITAIH